MVAPVVEFFTFVLSTSVIYIFSGVGLAVAGRIGNFLVLQEGVMQLSGSVAFLVAYLAGGNLALGLLAGAIMAGAYGLIFCVFSVTLKQNQFIVGLTLFIMASGMANFLYGAVIPKSQTLASIPTLQGVHIPLLSDIPYIGPILFSQNAVFWLAIGIAVAFWYLLFRTNYGLNVRSVGESPRVADTLGIGVTRTRYLFTILGTMVIGLAGAYIPLFFTGAYSPSLVNGRGWIAIAVVLLGAWNPVRTVVAGLIFAGFEVFSTYGMVLNLPVSSDFLLMIPFIVTLVVLIQVYRTAELPHALGRVYDRESVEE